MFFVLTLSKNLVVTPEYLGPNLYFHIIDVLKRTVEGSCSPRYGYLLKVLKMGEIGEGKVKDGAGDVVFQVTYRALVFMPYPGEVLDAVITEASALGFFADAGPMRLFVSAQSNISLDYRFDQHAKPLAGWVNTEDIGVRLEAGKTVRVRLNGMQVETNEIYGVCTIAEDFLGPVVA